MGLSRKCEGKNTVICFLRRIRCLFLIAMLKRRPIPRSPTRELEDRLERDELQRIGFLQLLGLWKFPRHGCEIVSRRKGNGLQVHPKWRPRHPQLAQINRDLDQYISLHFYSYSRLQNLDHRA